MVIVGFIITFVMRSGRDVPPLSPWELILGIAFGLIYLAVGLNDRPFFELLPAGWAEMLFFLVQCGLIFGVGLTLGVGGSWLMGIPLAGFAVEMLEPERRWAVYIGVVACAVLPLGLREGNWISALVNSVTTGTAVIFVAIFAQMRLNEQKARERAEQLTLELERANTQLAAYATQAEELAMTQERNRVAREIHDNLGHTLTIVNVQIEAAKAVMGSDPGRALDAMKKAQNLAQEGLIRVRESVSALRESPVNNRSLDNAIEDLTQAVESSGIVTGFRVTGEPFTVDHKVALALYRAAQEALTNVCRHSRASRIDVNLEFRLDEVRLEVKDNGVGAGQIREGFGLLGIRERMQLLGGSLEIDTGTGKGFRLYACVPVSPTGRLIEPEV